MKQKSMRWRLLCCLVAIGCLFGPRTYSQVCCLTNSLNISTGLNPVTGTLVAVPSLDPRWRVTSISPALAADASASATLAPIGGQAYVIVPFGGWPTGGGSWINCFNSNTYTSTANGTDEMTLQRTFTLCLPATITVNGTVCADNYIPNMTIGATTIYSQAYPGDGFMSGCQPMTAVIALPAGTHTLRATVRQDPTGAGCGFSFNGTINAGSAAIVREDNPSQCSNYATSCGPTVNPATICQGNTATLTALPAGGTWTSLNTSIATVITATGVATGVAPGTATIVYTDLCGNTTTQVITVLPAPDASISGTYHVCSGEIVSIPVTGTTVSSVSYSSSAGSGTVSVPGTISLTAPVTSSGTSFVVSLTGTTGSSCPFSGTSATVIVDPLPPCPTVTETTGNRCAGGTLTFCVSGMPGATIVYSYSSEPGGPSSHFATLSASGTFCITVPAVAPGTTFYLEGITDPVSGCTRSCYASFPICVAPHLTFGGILGPDDLCETETGYYTGSFSGGPGGYTGFWSISPGPSSGPGSATLVGPSSSSVSVLAETAGVATLTFAGSNCCESAIVTKNINIHTMPVIPTVTYTGCSLPCPGMPLNFTVHGTPGAAFTWSWTDVGGGISPSTVTMLDGMGDATISLPPTAVPGTVLITIYNAILGMCTNTAGVDYPQTVDWPKASMQIRSTELCVGDCTTIEVYGPPGGTVFITPTPGGLTMSIPLDAMGYGGISLCPPVTTTYQITGVIGCCTYMYSGPSTTVTVYTYPVVTLTHSTPCLGSPLVLTATSTTPPPYSWYLPGVPPFMAGSSYTVTPYLTSADDGTYTVEAYNGPCATKASTTVKTIKPWATIKCSDACGVGYGVGVPVTITITGTPGATVYINSGSGPDIPVLLDASGNGTYTTTISSTTTFVINNVITVEGCHSGMIFAGCTATYHSRPPCMAAYNSSTGLINITGWGPGQTVTFMWYDAGPPLTSGTVTVSYSMYPGGIPLSIFPTTSDGLFVTAYNNDTCNWTYLIDECYIPWPSPKPGRHDEYGDGGTVISVMPNPNNGSFTVAGETVSLTTANTLDLEIVDVLGKTVYAKNVGVTNGHISEELHIADRLVSGTYLLRVKGNLMTTTYKVLIQR